MHLISHAVNRPLFACRSVQPPSHRSERQEKSNISCPSLLGNRSVAIESDNPTIAQEAISWLRQRFSEVHRPATPSPVQQIQAAFAPSEPLQQTPVCAIHHQPMKMMHGKRGTFWSCHEKNSDGSWCSYKPTNA